jgi:hypothetical protein
MEHNVAEKYYNPPRIKRSAVMLQTAVQNRSSGHYKSRKIIHRKAGCNPKALMNHHKIRYLESPYFNEVS